ncbi:OmpA family protein [Photobacterium kishitanii]|uniref:OmpA family protein n=1 Tax=Photobacterium kishitanii TaxID=318456 RepID=UPI000D17A93D|nr:OmpA family protein [Photobacterium kishitanii]PSV06062.1 OmpA family protein [Photobacterium kishitanii]PSV74746.1 OmpA family protein [Photobacterium kishitanii]
MELRKLKHNLGLILILSLFFTPGCTTFAEPGRGGGTNNYLNTRSTILEHLQPLGPEDGLRFEWELVARHLDELIMNKSQWCFPATVLQAQQNESRIASELVGGLEIDATNSLIIQRNLLQRLEQQTNYAKKQKICQPPIDSDTDTNNIVFTKKIYNLLNKADQFIFNSSELDPKYIVNLSVASQLLAKNDNYKILITGHSDSFSADIPASQLARQRAEQIQRYLSIFGLNPNRIHIDSIDSQPPSFSTPQAREHLSNRRVTIELMHINQPLMLDDFSWR